MVNVAEHAGFPRADHQGEHARQNRAAAGCGQPDGAVRPALANGGHRVIQGALSRPAARQFGARAMRRWFGIDHIGGCMLEEIPQGTTGRFRNSGIVQSLVHMARLYAAGRCGSAGATREGSTTIAAANRRRDRPEIALETRRILRSRSADSSRGIAGGAGYRDPHAHKMPARVCGRLWRRQFLRTGVGPGASKLHLHRMAVRQQLLWFVNLDLTTLVRPVGSCFE